VHVSCITRHSLTKPIRLTPHHSSYLLFSSLLPRPSLYSILRNSIAAIANASAPGFYDDGFRNAYEYVDDGDYGGYPGVYGYGGGYESTETKKTKFTAMAKQILTLMYDHVRESEDKVLTTFRYINDCDAICPRFHKLSPGRQYS
jgi:hypothetical protein